jgi:hypothetical protein
MLLRLAFLFACLALLALAAEDYYKVGEALCSFYYTSYNC